MKSKVILFSVTKIGQTSNDKLFAVLSSDKPQSTLGALNIVGKSTVYRVEIDSLPKGLKLQEIGKNGKKFTKEIEMEKIPIKHVQLTELRPFEPEDFKVEEREVIGDDGVARHYKWLVKEQV